MPRTTAGRSSLVLAACTSGSPFAMLDNFLEKTLDGRYRLVKNLGAGGFGKTYLAEDTRRPGNPTCVVKQLRIAADTGLLEIARRLFNTEAETLQKLGRHPQIPDLLAYFEQDGEFYLVQEFIPGQPLSRELVVGPMAEPRVVALLEDVLGVLAFVHAQGVIHRDIKPDNLMRHAEDGRLVLIDFGAVKEVGTRAATVVAGVEADQPAMTVAIGTAGYMPAEQAAGAPRFASDLYALGMVAIQALTGVSPVDFERDPRTEDLLWPAEVRVSTGLKTILLKMVRYNFTQRYPSAEAVLADLKKLGAGAAAAVVVNQRAEELISKTQEVASQAGQSLVTAAETYKEPVLTAAKKGGEVGARAGAFVLTALAGFLGRMLTALWDLTRRGLARVPRRVWWLGGSGLVLAGGVAAFIALRPPADPDDSKTPTGPGVTTSALRSARQMLTSSTSKPTSVLGVNLIVNGDAEASEGAAVADDLAFIPGWSLGGNVTALQYNIPEPLVRFDDPGPKERGRSYFAGGPDAAVATATQTVDLTAGAASVDQGNLSYELSGWLGGKGSDADSAILKAVFRDAQGAILGEGAIGPVGPSERSYDTRLVRRASYGTLPARTRRIEFTLTFTRPGKDYNHAFADNLALVLSGPPFTDLGEAFGSKQILELAQLGVFDRLGGTFEPIRPVTRAEFVRWLVRANNAIWAEKPERQVRLAEGGTASFTDVPPDHPDFKYVQGMMNAGFAIGYDETTFRPDEPLTREQMVAIKVGLDQGGLRVPSSDYIPAWTDRDRISDFFRPALQVEFYANDRVKNVERTFGTLKTFRPQMPVTRAEAAVCMSLIGPGADGGSPRSSTEALADLREKQ